MEDNPFTVPLSSESSGTDAVRPGSRPHRLEVAAGSCAPLGRALLLINLAWGATLLVLLVILWLEEQGQSIPGFGAVAMLLLGWIAQISPYHVPLTGLACLNVAAVCVGLMHVFTLQSYTLARFGAVAACLPLIGPWLGLTAPLGLVLLGRLRRRAVRQAFLNR